MGHARLGREGGVAREWSCAEWMALCRLGARGSYHPESWVDRRLRQRKGSMQGGKNQHLKIAYRQTGHLQGGRACLSVLAASTLLWAAVCREALLSGLGLVAAFRHRLWEGGLRALTGHVHLASRLHNMGSPQRQLTASSNCLVFMNRLWVP